MNTWVLITLIAVGHGRHEVTQAREFPSYEQCMVERMISYKEKIKGWRYECAPLIDEKAIRRSVEK
jgi:hypothetical protein